LTGELADGWLGVFLDPAQAQRLLAPLREGLAAGPERPFDVSVTTMAVAGPEQAAALAPMRAQIALYVGGMGSREQNFYHRLVAEQGFAAEAAEIQDRFLAGRHREAAEAVPDALLEATCLLGSAGQLRDRLRAYASAGVTTVCVTPTAPTLEDRVSTLRLLADALAETGLSR
jgi:alkanesulfonate monooxygenase SsuD/methylene tetrahydromethanopterin reductase-like flavin-dependent oxidoreductase (luciferase family)